MKTPPGSPWIRRLCLPRQERCRPQADSPNAVAEKHLASFTMKIPLLPAAISVAGTDETKRRDSQGAVGLGDGGAGDLYIEIALNPHPAYQADDADLYLDLPVTPWEAALGAKVKVPTPDGVVDLKVPEGSRQGRKLRLKGRGFPAKPPGNLYANLQIALPPAGSAKAKELYKKMARGA